MDVSADLTELGRTPVALVTSGKLADNPTVYVVEGFPTMLATLQGCFQEARHKYSDIVILWLVVFDNRMSQLHSTMSELLDK